ncbi:MAG: type II toxin-antitoxin system RelE/ParE family toxin [Rhizobiaceae bacterium]|nr:type II toxin-antitoxin system RelE/ParE family toxin [Rhizobiaceae bacterium]
MARRRYSKAAQNDLLQILRFIARESASQKVALKFTSDLRYKCSHLASLPGWMGRPRPELGDEIRSFTFRGYVIMFRYVDNVFEVERIYEGHRDIENDFGPDSE